MRRDFQNPRDLKQYRNYLKTEPHDPNHEIRVCTGGGCIASGAIGLLSRLAELLEEEDLPYWFIRETGCMGPCAHGPVLAIGKYYYRGITEADLPRIAEEHLKHGRPVNSLLLDRTPEGDVEEGKGFFEGQHKVVLRNCGFIDPLNIDDAIERDGYAAVGRILDERTPAEKIIAGLKTSGLRGRGGAGFPTWRKWEMTRAAEGNEKFVLCNADEGDPGAFMDRSVLEGDPHSLIEGMIVAAYTIGASRGFVYVRAEYPLAVSRLKQAIRQARDCGLLGENILGCGFSFDLDIRMGSGAFVCGEETALIASIEGRRGEPRSRPPFPAQKGLWGKPTLLNNVETYANIPAILTEGPEVYARLGTEKSRGTKVFALAGAVNNTGLVEVPIGTALGDLIFDTGGGIKGGRQFKAAQMGGPSGGCIPREHLNVPLDYESLKELGAIIGSGGLIVMDDETCMVDVARFFLEFVQEESCGKCVPCRVGTKRMLEILERICNGDGKEEDIERLEELGHHIQDTALCGLGQTAPNPVLSTIRHFRKEYEEHIRDKHCAAGICPNLVRAPCQSACPASVDVPGFVSLINEGRYAEALRLHRDRNPFAAVCARVCFHTCEDHCRRSTLDESVSIRALKRFMVDREVTIELPECRENKENAGRKIAIVGAGPAGLSCAYFLARLGYKPDIYEASVRPGGMLVQTIPAYRLPRETLAREIRMIEHMGVRIHTGRKLGKDFSLESLRNENEAVFLAVGAPESLDMGLPGERMKGIVQAVPYLREYNIKGSVRTGRNVVVIGGGNAAVDAARTALRLEAESVTIIYRRSQEAMPAYEEEIENALEEGVVLQCMMQPLEYQGDEKGHVRALRCMPMTEGEYDKSGRRRPVEALQTGEIELETDQVIIAIGQRLETKKLLDGMKFEKTPAGFILADPVTGESSEPGIFAGGDAADGPSSVVRAIAAGERAAAGIDLKLTGENHAFWRIEKEVDTAFDPDADPQPYPREKLPVLQAARRTHSFEEVELCWDEHTARRQASRCLRCDYGKKIRCTEAPAADKEKSHV